MTLRASAAHELEVLCPATGRVWTSVRADTEEDVDRAASAAARALAGPWSRTSRDARADLLARIGVLLHDDADELARIETMDTGKPLRETRDQVRAAASWCEYFAALTRTLEGRYIELDDGVSAHTALRPSGVVCALLPGNSPLLLAVWKLAPCLAIGNTMIVKPSAEAPVTVVRLAALLERAGVPQGVVNVVTGRDAELGPALLSHPDVDHVSFTGSTAAGRRVAREAAGHGKRLTLELGASNAMVIFDDAHIENAVRAATEGSFVAAGQTCARSARILVQAGSYERVVTELAERASRIRVGDPLEAMTEMGPLRSAALREAVDATVQAAVTRGASLEAGGRVPPAQEEGFYYEPTVLAGVDADDPAAHDETFGPVTVVMPFETEAEAVALANGTRYGLTAGVWTGDGNRARRTARAMRAGLTWVNTYRRVHWSIPYGGTKASGFGRENGAEALREYSSTAAVMVDGTGEYRDAYGSTDLDFTTHFGQTRELAGIAGGGPDGAAH